jgi:hypothetical protein
MRFCQSFEQTGTTGLHYSIIEKIAANNTQDGAKMAKTTS